MTVEISGRLNVLLGEQAYPNKIRGVWGKMVAEERYRFSHNTQICDIAFDRALNAGLFTGRNEAKD